MTTPVRVKKNPPLRGTCEGDSRSSSFLRATLLGRVLPVGAPDVTDVTFYSKADQVVIAGSHRWHVIAWKIFQFE